MALTPGTRLGPYEVTARIGVGGMGEVYKATDTNLKRAVAIKVLPASVAGDAERLARFQREAEVLAALNHPNIAQIHGLEKSDGTIALVMELVEGPTLADRIAQGAIPFDEALSIAKQIADALEAAHEQGIIHRDLKPANIKVRPDGTVKVLDFGLAKAMAPTAGSAPSNSMSPTITTPAMTQAGIILGTAAYMSPEQAKGREADKRSDVWAFGAVLYEMLTGRRAFEGDDLSDTLANVLKVDPDWSRLPAEVLPLIRTLLRHCLEKDPRRRVANVAGIQFALTHAQAPDLGRVPSLPSPVPSRALWKRLAVPSVALLLGAMATGAAIFFLQTTSPQLVTRLTMLAPADAPVAFDGNDRALAIAPDGSKIAYTSASASPYNGAPGGSVRLFIRALDQLQPTVLAGPGAVRDPFFSPDGAWVGFFDPTSRLQRVSPTGGPPVPITSVDGASRGATWGLDDTIIFATNSLGTGLQQVSANGGAPKVLTRPNREKGERDHFWPHLLPGGRRVLFTIQTDGPSENAQIAMLDLRDGSQKVVLNGGSDARYVPGGYLVYGVSGTLRAVAFDVDRLEVRGTPVPVVQQVVTGSQAGSITGWANFAVAANGTLTYMSGGPSSSTAVYERTLVWVDRTGREETIGVPARQYQNAQLSPDGTRIALEIRDQQQDVWIWDVARQTLQRLTFDPEINRGGLWTPDGVRVAFTRVINGIDEVFWQAADGSGMAEALTKGSSRNVMPSAFSADASALVYETNFTPPPNDIRIVRIGGAQASAGEPILASPAEEHAGAVSPDGRWLAYESNESGRFEVYVRPFPSADKGRWQISTRGGAKPHWRRDGRELFYIEQRADAYALMAVPVTSGPGFVAGSPAMLFQGAYYIQGNRLSYDVAADGKRFLMIKIVEPAEGTVAKEVEPPHLNVVLNWVEELKRLVPTN